MNFIASNIIVGGNEQNSIVNSVRVDNWIAERAIIAVVMRYKLQNLDCSRFHADYAVHFELIVLNLSSRLLKYSTANQTM